MARIRTIKPEFWAHEELSELPEATHILAAALLNYADDEGYFNANVKLISAACFPIREPSVSVPESIRSLQSVDYIRLGSAPDGKRYGRIVAFLDHQRISHPTESKIKELQIEWEDSGKIPEGSAVKGKEQGTGNGREILPDTSGQSNPKPYSEDFELFWKAYPTDANMPKKAAFSQWKKLSKEKRDRAVAAVPGFRRYCEQNKSWYRVVYADRFLNQEKFEGYAAEPELTPEQIAINMDRADRLLRRGKYAEGLGHG